MSTHERWHKLALFSLNATPYKISVVWSNLPWYFMYKNNTYCWFSILKILRKNVSPSQMFWLFNVIGFHMRHTGSHCCGCWIFSTLMSSSSYIVRLFLTWSNSSKYSTPIKQRGNMCVCAFRQETAIFDGSSKQVENAQCRGLKVYPSFTWSHVWSDCLFPSHGKEHHLFSCYPHPMCNFHMRGISCSGWVIESK